MGKLRVLSGREVCQILEGQGFAEIQRRGSPIVMQKKTGHTTITVGTSLLNRILKDAGIKADAGGKGGKS